MKCPSKSALLVLLLVFAFLTSSLSAADPSFEITKRCKNNLKMLREALLVYLKSTTNEPPRGDIIDFNQAYTMLLTSKFLPQKPDKPTTDCDYFLAYKDRDRFEWFCRIHGVISGDQRITFPYHEFEFTAAFNSNFMTNAKYKRHYDEVMRWTAYNRTLTESIKYHYTRNPTTTAIMVFFGALLVLYIYRNIFG